MHPREKSFECETCLKVFNGKVNQVVHTKIVGSKEKSFTCTACLKKFGRKFDLDKYTKIVHSKDENLKGETLKCIWKHGYMLRQCIQRAKASNVKLV